MATVRRICALPHRAFASYIFAHKRVGGLGLLDPTLEADIQAIIHAVKMLSCSDLTVINIANAEVNQTVVLLPPYLLFLIKKKWAVRFNTTDTFANGSTWQYNGLNIRFRDWRFIHRARLNCLPVNSVKSRWSNSYPKCRHCDSDETLPHVLCHCLPNMPSILRRHNSIVDRIVNAVQYGTITTDQLVPAANSRLRPDIIVEEDNKVLIIDVRCPFDNDAEALRP